MQGAKDKLLHALILHLHFNLNHFCNTIHQLFQKVNTYMFTELRYVASYGVYPVSVCTGATTTESCCSLGSAVKEKCRYVEIIQESPPVVPTQAGYILLKMVRGCEYETALHTPAARPSFLLILLNSSLTFSITSQNKHLQLEAQKLAARSQEEIDLSQLFRMLRAETCVLFYRPFTEPDLPYILERHYSSTNAHSPIYSRIVYFPENHLRLNSITYINAGFSIKSISWLLYMWSVTSV